MMVVSPHHPAKPSPLSVRRLRRTVTVERLIRPETEHLVNHFHIDTAGQLWMHRDFQALPVGPDGTPSEVGNQAGVHGRGPMVVCASRAGGIWVADTGLRRWHQSHWAEDRGSLPWPDPGLTALMETKAGDLWVGTYTKGLYVTTRSGERYQVNTRSGLSHNTVSCLWEDHEGSVWVGTGGGGLSLLRRKRVRMVGPPDNWQDHPVLCVTTNHTGGLWVGTEGAGVYAYNRGEWRNYDDRHGILRRDAWSVHEDKAGGVWVGSAWNGVLKMDGDGFVPAPGWPEPTWIIYSLLGGKGGELWAGGERGVGWLKGDVWQIVSLDPTLAEQRIRHIAQDASGTTWFATAGNGLWRFRDGQLARYGRAAGLATDYLTCLLVDADQNLWIGTKGAGLWRYRDGGFAAITTRNGLPTDSIASIAADQGEHLWLGTPRGLVRVSRSKLNQCVDRQLETVDCLQLDLTDGLKSLEFEGPNQPNACRAADGRLWFATGAGLAQVDPKDVYTNSLPPPVLINEVLIDGQAARTDLIAGPAPAQVRTQSAAPLVAPVVIPPGRNKLEIRYAGLSYAAPSRMRFRHRLEGIEGDWSEAGNSRVAYYNYLPPGDYTFRVIACNNDGVWNSEGAALSFRLLPHYWQTWWFRAASAGGAAALLAVSLAAFFRRRSRRKLQALERQRAVELERMRIAQDIHDDLGASLTRISLLSESALGKLPGQASAATDISRIQQTTLDLTYALDEIVWAVNPRHDTLNSLVNYLTNYAEEALGTAGVKMRLEVPLSLPAWPLTADVRHNLFLAAKEALHNVTKHARASEVRLSLQLSTDSFTLELADNGIGFASAAQGNGLWSMNKRLQDIGGSCQIQSRPGQGTRVRFSVRLGVAGHAELPPESALSSKQTMAETSNN